MAMLLHPSKLIIVLVLIPFNALSVPESEGQSASQSRCTIFLAPSTIEGAGLGVFTSESISRGAKIGVPDVIVPIVDLRLHHPNIYWMLHDYVWDGRDTMGMHREGDDEHLDAYAPGIDCLVNCHLGLLNVERTFPIYDTTLPHRHKYPSAGSMTAYWNNCSSYAKVDVPAGAELFKHYGNDWFTSRNDVFVNIPFAKHYRDAGHLVKKIKTLFHDTLSLSEEAQQDLYNIILSPQSATLNALPRHVHQIDKAANEGIRSVLQLNHIRDNLQDMPNARCFESIVPGPSTIEGAGRGGFAAWSFQQGQVITGSPLMHLVDKKELEMYDLDSNDGSASVPPEVLAHQLLMNYCWGHPETDLMLCPYGAGINLLNHSRERANVKIQWAPNGHLSQDDSWFSTSVKDMGMSFRCHLAWDYVALADIAEGEELLIDYGDEWVNAWENHVEEWQNAEKPSEHAEYMSAAEWNEVYAEADIRTVREQRENPYPDYIEMVCHPSVNANDYERRQQESSVWNLWHIAQDGVPCRVMARLSSAAGSTYYTVQMNGAGGSVLTRRNVMRKMIRFRDADYSTDMHLDGVFRKEATLPNDMLPMAWRRQKEDDEHDEL
jgi:hypothetical protein